METQTLVDNLGNIIFSCLGFITFLGMIFILLSIIYDPKEISKQEYLEMVAHHKRIIADNEPASVILDNYSDLTYDFDQLKES